MKRVNGIAIFALAIFALFITCKSPVEVEINVGNFTVTFDKNGGDTEASPKTKTVTPPATTIDAPPTAPTREGYTFTEWNTAKDGSGTAFTASTLVTASITVYAQWVVVPPGSFVVTFDKNGGDTNANPLSKVVTPPATTIDALPTPPTRSGYDFTGWNTEDDGTGAEFTAATTVTADITVYAQWEEVVRYTIAIEKSGEVSGDLVTVSSESGEAGDTITISYTLVGGFLNNRLVFSGTTEPIGEVNETGSGTKEYVVDGADADLDGIITIIATFTHTNKEIDTIAFTDNVVNRTYGDGTFTEPVSNAGVGSGAITYSSGSPDVATVNSTSGAVTILKAGSSIITATKAEDATYAGTSASYTLHVAQLQLTIDDPSGTTTKPYDGTTTATGITAGSLTNKVDDDDVSVTVESAEYNSADVATANTITVTYSISGADASNYHAPEDSEINGAITKAAGAALTGPLVSSGITQTSIEINAVTAPTNGQTVEYAIAETNTEPSDDWQDETSFSGLTAGTTYYIFARAKADGNHNMGTAISGTFTTEAAPSKDAGATVTGPVTVYRLRDTSVRINTIAAPSNGQTVEYAVAIGSTAPTSGWQDGRDFTGLTAGTAYYAFARAKENTTHLAGTAVSVAFTTKAAPTNLIPPIVVDFETPVTTGAVGRSTITTTIVNDPANANEKSLQLTLDGNNNWGGGAYVLINLPSELKNFQSFSFRFYLPAASSIQGDPIRVYVTPSNYSFPSNGEFIGTNNNNLSTPYLIGTAAYANNDYNRKDRWIDYDITIDTLPDGIQNLSGIVKLAIGMRTGSAPTYLLDDLTFIIKDGITPNSSISPTSATFIKAAPADIPVEMSLYGNTLSSIENGGTALPDSAYTVNGSTVTLNESYLTTLNPGNVTLTFVFDQGENSDIVIKIVDNDADLEILAYNFVAATSDPGGWIMAPNDANVGTATWSTGDGLRIAIKTKNDIVVLPFRLPDGKSLSNYKLYAEVAGVSGDIGNKPFNAVITTNVDKKTFTVRGNNNGATTIASYNNAVNGTTPSNFSTPVTFTSNVSAAGADADGYIWIGFYIHEMNPTGSNPTANSPSIYRILRVELKE